MLTRSSPASALQGCLRTTVFSVKLLTRVARSSTECFDVHLGGVGGYQTADLGDGNGNITQTMELRQDLEIGGACAESVVDGNRFRMSRRNRSDHNTDALTLLLEFVLYWRFQGGSSAPPQIKISV